MSQYGDSVLNYLAGHAAVAVTKSAVGLKGRITVLSKLSPEWVGSRIATWWRVFERIQITALGAQSALKCSVRTAQAVKM